MKGARGKGGSEKGQSSSSSAVAANSSFRTYRVMWVAVACFALPVLVFVSGIHKSPLTVAVVSNIYAVMPSQQQRAVGSGGRDGVSGASNKLQRLVAADRFDAESCLSRQESSLYYKDSPWVPSPYLVERLRKYEARHKLCSQNTDAFNRSVSLVTKRGNLTWASPPPPECKYVVWMARDGLGNRMLSLAATFLFALLSDRVLLIDPSFKDITDLFCEPFPGSTWLLPSDFPLEGYHRRGGTHPASYGKMLENGNFSSASAAHLPPMIFLPLAHDFNDMEKLFFCESRESAVHTIPWMVVRSNQYFVPALFMNPAYEDELRRLFPEKESFFHLLSRYLFHPTNDVWGLITRYYQAYLAMAGEKLGIQVRVFHKDWPPFEVVMQQILNCTLKEKLLPEVAAGVGARRPPASAAADPDNRALKSVLLTSLIPEYFDRIKDMYWEHPTAGVRAVSVHQPSHEEKQQTETATHDMKALAEIYLLSFSDQLVTTAWSTFGYIAQGLGGMRPYLLTKVRKAEVPEPACAQAMSMEPCYHFPPNYNCRERKQQDEATMVPYLRRCEDAESGVKFVDGGRG